MDNFLIAQLIIALSESMAQEDFLYIKPFMVKAIFCPS